VRSPSKTLGRSLVLLAVLLASAVPSIARGQPLPISLPTAKSSLDVIRKYQIKRVGSLEVAPLIFEGIRLFDVSAPAGRDPQAFPAVASRIDVIQDNLNDVVPPVSGVGDVFRPQPTRYDPETFEVKVGTHNGYTTLVAADGKGTKETALLTLTDQDAKYNGVTVHELALTWADTLQSVLGNALREREPGAFERQLSAAAYGLLVVLVLSALLIGLRLLLSRWRSSLDAQLEAADEPTEAVVEDLPARRARARTLRGGIIVLHWLLSWAIVVVWGLGALYILYQFAATQGLARTLGGKLATIFIIWFVAELLSRLGGLLIVQLARSWKERPFLSLDAAGRRYLRFPTIVRTVDYAKTMVIYLAASAVTLGVVGASASAVVTLGAALAFAVSFGAQSLVKDFVNGFLILIEDQFAIGDYVTIGTASGFIDGVTLRITQLRSDDGRLITIPNSQVAVIENWTRSFSRVDYRIAVAFDSDAQAALDVFDQVLKDVARDPQWSRLITEPPRVLGIDAVSSLGMVLRAWVQTSPGKMFMVSREINRRMHDALAAAGIPLGMPISRVFRNEPDPSPSAHAQPEHQGEEKDAT
jgi:moderate conductance mechanosensitive channel